LTFVVHKLYERFIGRSGLLAEVILYTAVRVALTSIGNIR